MAIPIRRVVTGHGADGRSTVLVDAPAPNVVERAAGNASTLLWVADRTPADVDGAADGAARSTGVPPPDGGSLFRIIEMPPDGEAGPHPGNEAMLANLGIARGIVRGAPPRHPSIHRTRSLDYVIVLEGQVTLLLDEGEVTLGPGDVVVQRATNHGWINRGAVPCRLAMVFVDASEPRAVLDNFKGDTP